MDGRGMNIGSANLSSTGDINYDGYSDIYVREGARSRSYVLFGPFSGEMTISEADVQFVGSDFDAIAPSAAPGDVNGDGFKDLLIGAPSISRSGDYPTYKGMWGGAYLASGPLSGTIDLVKEAYRWHGADRGDYTGFTVSTSGDLTGDGLPDMLVSAPLAGNTYLIAGGTVF